MDLAIEAVRRAINDAGISKPDIDGLVVGGLPMYDPFMYRAGMQDVRFLAHYPLAGRLCPQALAQAVLAVHHGMANYVVLFNAVSFKSGGQTFGGDTTAHDEMGMGRIGPLYDLAYGMTSPGRSMRWRGSRYLHLYGGTDTDLAGVAISTRQWASKNPERDISESPELRGVC